MTETELLNTITNSIKSDWTENFDEDIEITSYVLKNDLAVSIEMKETGDYEGEDWVKLFPDNSAQKVEVKVNYNSVLIKKFLFAYTDGRRYLFPLPIYKDGKVFFNDDEIAIGRIFSSGSLFDTYLAPVKTAFLKQIQEK